MTEILVSDLTYHDVQNPMESTFSLENIAVALGNTCRYGGHLKDYDPKPPRVPTRVMILNQQVPDVKEVHSIFYSVAEHSVLGAKYHLSRGETTKAKLFLLHDAAEPFIGGDIPTPIKNQLPILKEWEKECQKLILDRYNLLSHSFDEIKETDWRICRNECIALFEDNADWAKNIEPLFFTGRNQWDKTLVRLKLWTPREAATQWYNLAVELGLQEDDTYA